MALLSGSVFLMQGCECIEPADTGSESNFMQKWKSEFNRTVFTSSMIGSVYSDMAYIVISDKLYIVDIETGSLRSVIDPQVDTKLIGARNVIVDNEGLIISYVKWVRKYDRMTGQLIWEWPLNENEAMVLTEMYSDEANVYVPKKGGVYVIDRTTGILRKTIDLKDILNLEDEISDILVREAIKTDDGKILFGTESYNASNPIGIVASIDLGSEQADWVYYSEIDSLGPTTEFPPISKMAFCENILLFLRGSNVHAVDVHTGEELWRKRYPDLGFFFGLRVSEDGVAYIGSTAYERVVIALDAETGEERWRNNLALGSIQFLQVKDDLLFVLAEHLVILNRHTGEKIFDFVGDTGDFFYVPPTIGDDCFIGVSSQRVYCWSYE